MVELWSVLKTPTSDTNPLPVPYPTTTNTAVPAEAEPSHRDYALPLIGRKRANAIMTADGMRGLLPIWSTKREPPRASVNASAPYASGPLR